MKVLYTLKTALLSLLLNKIRTFLTMLGVIIGVFAIIVLVSTVKGVQNYVADQFSALGSDLIIIAPGRVDISGDPSRAFTNNKLSEKHYELVARNLGDKLVGVSPAIRLGKAIKYKTKTYSASIRGTNETAKIISDIRIDNGRFLSKGDVSSGSRVAVIGADVKNKLFSKQNPVGAKIKIDNKTFEVIGSFAAKSSTFDDGVYIPYTTVQTVFAVDNFSAITAKARDTSQLKSVMKEIEYTLRRELKKDDFSVLSQSDLLSSVQNILQILSLGLMAIAAISLIVGGIGIMNIMLVSVAERTREIGLRKALGATPFNIGSQFLAEAVFLSVTGGLLGLAFGWGAVMSLNRFFRTEVPWWVALLSTGFSLAVGLVFGTYPAISAGRKDPIESLRYE